MVVVKRLLSYCFIICLVVVGLFAVSPLQALAQSQETALGKLTATYEGTVIGKNNERHNGLYDLQPSVLYDISDSDRNQRYKMWWFGQWDGGQDIPPDEHTDADRIYYATSKDGIDWSTPQVVLKALAGTGVDQVGRPRNAADDHTLGSPSVIKLRFPATTPGTRYKYVYYMFYECYGNWATAVRRFFNSDLGDTWVTNGASKAAELTSFDFNSETAITDWKENYGVDSTEKLNDVYGLLGYAPRYRKVGTHPVYSCEVKLPNNKLDRYLVRENDYVNNPTENVCKPAQGMGRVLNGGEPVFWLYDKAKDDRKALYAMYDLQFSNSFATLTPVTTSTHVPAPQQVTGDNILGYVATNLEGPDMIGALQNRICLAKWDSEINKAPKWERVMGKGRDGAIVMPWQETGMNTPPTDIEGNADVIEFDIQRQYGAGFPIAFERDRQIELYFIDETYPVATGNPNDPKLWGITIPKGGIENPDTYENASRNERRQAFTGGPGDIKWSEGFKRYFSILLYPNHLSPPILAWSEKDPKKPWDNPSQNPLDYFAPAESDLTKRSIKLSFPADRTINQGGIIGNDIGHILDFHKRSPAETRMKTYISAHPDVPGCTIREPGDCYDNHLTDIDLVDINIRDVIP
ncbi:MAG: hypothetical protein KTR27_01680 [Leptolyngbyaceae cyanobacterium MAG.088]|nr:hypothetical protein [Leptolyngbyaceae cyanobacterium MAG.088]